MTYKTAPDGTVLRACSIPDCDASYDAFDGPPAHECTRERHWARRSSPGVLVCPDHAWLFTHHAPRLDHETRTASCGCGLSLPGPTLGHMATAWIAHAAVLLNPQGD